MIHGLTDAIYGCCVTKLVSETNTPCPTPGHNLIKLGILYYTVSVKSSLYVWFMFDQETIHEDALHGKMVAKIRKVAK